MFKLLSCITTDWSQFWPGMIATFAGFVLALLGQFFWEKCTAHFNSELRKVKVSVFLRTAFFGAAPLEVWGSPLLSSNQLAFLARWPRFQDSLI